MASVASECYEILKMMMAEIQGLKDQMELLDLRSDPPEEITIPQPVRAGWGGLEDASIVARLSHIEERPGVGSCAVYVAGTASS